MTLDKRWLGAALVLVGVLAPPAVQRPAAGSVYVVPITGTIELGLAPFVERSLEEAVDAGASAVVLDVDTPGGRVDAAERIADALGDTRIPVYAYVNRQAYSAGALISLAANRIYMRPGAVLGAATPVTGSGEKAPEKIVSAMRSKMRSLAEARGLDPAVAEAMVDEDVAVEGVVEAGKLLTLTTEDAVRLGYAVEIPDMDGLLRDADLSGSRLVRTEVNWAERVVRFLSHPAVAPFLLSLGFLGLIIEVKTAGLGLAGLAGVIALTLFFGSHLIIGLAGLEDVILVGAGGALIAVEVFLVPGFGLFGIAGGIAVLVGLYMSMLGRIPTLGDFARAGSVLSTALLLILVTAWALLRHLPRSDRLARRGIFLLSRTDKDTGYTSADVRKELVGQKGRAITDLRPSGVGLFGEERVDVVSESEWIEEGTPIVILASEGYRHVVRPLKDSEKGADEPETETV